MNKNVFDLIETFYENLYQRLYDELYPIHYKGLELTDIRVKFYLNKIINKKEFIEKVSDDNISELVEYYYERFFEERNKKASFLSFVKYLFRDILRYLYLTLLKKTQNVKNIDVFYFITNKKFLKYLKETDQELQECGKKTCCIFWNPRNVPDQFEARYIIPRPAFPKVWTMVYRYYHGLTSTIDRFKGFERVLEGKKIIFVEGCMGLMHLSALVANDVNCKTINLQWGFFAKTVTKAGWRNMPYNNFYVWGDFFKKEFQKYNQNCRIEVTGHPNLKVSANKVKKSKFLFTVQKELGSHISKKEVKNFIKLAFNYAKYEVNKEVIIRSHPDYPIPEYYLHKYRNVENVLIHDYRTHSLNDSFKFAKYCITISSTTAIESVSVGCFPLYIKINSLPLQVHNVFENLLSGYHVTTPEKITSHIEKLETVDICSHVQKLQSIMFMDERKHVDRILNDK